MINGKYILEYFGGRKYVFAIFVVILSYTFVLKGLLSVKDWIGFTSAIGVAYIIGNVASKK